VTSAVQTLREEAHKTGHLNSNEQEKVTTQGNTIIIEPANPETVYVPAYDPWLVYGAPIVAYPGWYPVPGIFWGGVGLSFGIGFGIGFFGGFGWGWGHWGYDWHGGRGSFDRHDYVSHSRDFGHGASITVISATVTLDTAASTMAADSTGLPVFTEARAFTEAPTFTHREAGTRAGSAALITAGTHEAFLRAVIRALAAAASTAVADMAVAVTTK